MFHPPRLVLAAALLLAGCADQPARVTQYLDPQTAVTIRATGEPFVYAHEAPEYAVNSRDYLSVGAVEVNNMGARKHYLVLVSWTTIDRKRVGVLPAPVAERIELAIGGRSRELSPAGHEPRKLGIGEPLFRPASGYVGESWYAVTPADLRALATAAPEAIVLKQESGTVTYVTWRAAAASLAEFVGDIPETPASAARR